MNLFIPVYYRLEKEVISLTDSISFDDKQLQVYSLAAADIIIWCAVEIEAISKELYIRTGGNPEPVDTNNRKREPYFDTECIQQLVDLWSIDKKRLNITHPNMYFGAEKSVLFPLHKAHKANERGSMGALYILNLYYADESFWFEIPMEQRR